MVFPATAKSCLARDVMMSRCPTGASVWPNGAATCSNCGVAARECLLEQQAIIGYGTMQCLVTSLFNQVEDQTLQVNPVSCLPERQPNGMHGISGKRVKRIPTKMRQSRQGRINGMGSESKQHWTDQPMAEGRIRHQSKLAAKTARICKLIEADGLTSHQYVGN